MDDEHAAHPDEERWLAGWIDGLQRGRTEAVATVRAALRGTPWTLDAAGELTPAGCPIADGGSPPIEPDATDAGYRTGWDAGIRDGRRDLVAALSSRLAALGVVVATPVATRRGRAVAEAQMSIAVPSTRAAARGACERPDAACGGEDRGAQRRLWWQRRAATAPTSSAFAALPRLRTRIAAAAAAVVVAVLLLTPTHFLPRAAADGSVFGGRTGVLRETVAQAAEVVDVGSDPDTEALDIVLGGLHATRGAVALKPVLKSQATSGAEEMRAGVVNWIGGHAFDEAADLVVSALQTGPPMVRRSAATALARRAGQLVLTEPMRRTVVDVHARETDAAAAAQLLVARRVLGI